MDRDPEPGLVLTPSEPPPPPPPTTIENEEP